MRLVHMSVCEHFNVHACKWYEYFITFINNYSRCEYVYLKHTKSNVLDKFNEFKAKLKRHLSKDLKSLQLDRDSEYMFSASNYFLMEHGIISQLSVFEASQQKGVVERRNETLLDIVRSMMSLLILLKSI